MKKVIKKIKNGWNILRHKGVRAFIEILLGQTKVVFRSIYFSTNNNKKSCARRLSQFSSENSEEVFDFIFNSYGDLIKLSKILGKMAVGDDEFGKVGFLFRPVLCLIIRH